MDGTIHFDFKNKIALKCVDGDKPTLETMMMMIMNQNVVKLYHQLLRVKNNLSRD